MLVLSRRENETIYIGNGIEVFVARIQGNAVRLAISAPREVPIVRGELVSGGRQQKQGPDQGPMRGRKSAHKPR